MGVAEIVVIPPRAEIIIKITYQVIRLVPAEGVLREHRQVPSFGVNRIRMGIATMADVPVSRKAETQVSSGLEGCVAPIVIGLLLVIGVDVDR